MAEFIDLNDDGRITDEDLRVLFAVRSIDPVTQPHLAVQAIAGRWNLPLAEASTMLHHYRIAQARADNVREGSEQA